MQQIQSHASLIVTNFSTNFCLRAVEIEMLYHNSMSISVAVLSKKEKMIDRPLWLLFEISETNIFIQMCQIMVGDYLPDKDSRIDIS